MSQMATRRSLPSAFLNKHGYGVDTNKNTDRLPEIPKNISFKNHKLLSGQETTPIVFVLPALVTATDPDDISKLVFSALISGSGVDATTLMMDNNISVDHVASMYTWMAQTEGPPPRVRRTRPAEPAADGTEQPADIEYSEDGEHAEYPKGNLPAWYKRLDVNPTQLQLALSVSAVELAAYAGILAHCIGKQPTAENMEAFNQRRRPAIQQFIPVGDLVIFTDNSPFLSLELLTKVHRTFNINIAERSVVMSAIIARDTPLVSGPPRMFYTIFRLSAGASLNPLLIIVKFARKYPQMYSLFPELETEYHAAAHALERFFDVNESQRMYLKVIFGSAYIPVKRDDVNSLLGVATFVLQQTETTLQHYKGGYLAPTNRTRVLEYLNITEAQAEDVPETVNEAGAADKKTSIKK
ncbi:MAG: nucleoprotein [Sclerotinia sclerotiorum negative-stranded RNA virus 9]|uniref:Nucleoprotein n=1 Tax=Sclerotinia sclerotiorum negative-stranded RNA virus 9 TaxID=2358186 RepID=A0AA45L1S8_9MONO|nr:MAG: nucleoprotein [Sclerotinia sclerotiorum negative-stranded RNA virus 9]